MKGILRKIEKKEFEVKTGKKKGQKFTKIEFTVDRINDKGQVKTLMGTYSLDFAKKYFDFVKEKTDKTSKDFIGAECVVFTEKKAYEKDGKTLTMEFVKFINVLDADGKAIYLPKADGENSNEIDF